VSTLVLSTSIGATRAMWDPQAAALGGDFDLVRYDHRGHGSSPVPPGPYSLADLGGDVIELLDARGIERAHFCGLSMGAMVGMWLAEHAPERVDRLVLCCTAARMDPAMWAERAESVRAARSVEQLADATIERWFTPRFAAEQPAVVARFRTMFAAQPAEGYASCAEAIGGMDIEDALGTIAAPTLVIAGSVDPSTPPEQGRAIADAIPGARYEVVDARHMANIEQEAAVTDLIREHLTA
jgi:3-oxoadipate enol-lactonase